MLSVLFFNPSCSFCFHSFFFFFFFLINLDLACFTPAQWPRTRPFPVCISTTPLLRSRDLSFLPSLSLSPPRRTPWRSAVITLFWGFRFPFFYSNYHLPSFAIDFNSHPSLTLLLRSVVESWPPVPARALRLTPSLTVTICPSTFPSGGLHFTLKTSYDMIYNLWVNSACLPFIGPVTIPLPSASSEPWARYADFLFFFFFFFFFLTLIVCFSFPFYPPPPSLPQTIMELLTSAKYEMVDIGRVVLVGGVARTPKFQNVIQAFLEESEEPPMFEVCAGFGGYLSWIHQDKGVWHLLYGLKLHTI